LPAYHEETYRMARDMVNPFDHTRGLEQSAADQMLRDFVAAMERITTVGYGQTPSVAQGPSGQNPTFTDEIVERVNGVVSSELNKPSGRSGIVFGEEHRNDEFPKLLAERIIPDASRMAGDRPKILFVEWDRTSRNLELIDEYMRTGNEDVAFTLTFYNIDLPDGGLTSLRNQLGDVRQTWINVLKAARDNGFQIVPYDEEGVSTDTIVEAELKKLGKTREQLTDAERTQIQHVIDETRVSGSNPVMVENVRSRAPVGALSLVVVGDDHAQHANDLPERLGYSYARFTEASVTAPRIDENTPTGATIDVTLMETDLDKNVQVDIIQRAGLEIAGKILTGREIPAGLSQENMDFARQLTQRLQAAGLLIQGKDYKAAHAELTEATALIRRRYTLEQIASDGYLSTMESLAQLSCEAIEKEIPDFKQAAQANPQPQTVMASKI
jgi:hypothetical protein